MVFYWGEAKCATHDDHSDHSGDDGSVFRVKRQYMMCDSEQGTNYRIITKIHLSQNRQCGSVNPSQTVTPYKDSITSIAYLTAGNH